MKAAKSRQSLHLPKCQIVGNLMQRLTVLFTEDTDFEMKCFVSPYLTFICLRTRQLLTATPHIRSKIITVTMLIPIVMATTVGSVNIRIQGKIIP